jgi:hypothetical protein
MPEDISRYDQVTHYWCPQLGQPINFAYCRRAQEGLPCGRVLTCFADHFDVRGFINGHYSPKERALFLSPPKGRMQRVVEALAQAGAQDEEPS